MIEQFDSDSNDEEDYGMVPADVDEKESKVYPCLVYINKFRKKCYGCGFYFTDDERVTPQDLIFSFLMFREWKKGGQLM